MDGWMDEGEKGGKGKGRREGGSMEAPALGQ